MATYNVLQEWQSCIYNNHIVYRQGRNYIALYFASHLLHDDIFFRPSNTHGLTVRLTVSGLISRSHEVTAKTHDFSRG